MLARKSVVQRRDFESTPGLIARESEAKPNAYKSNYKLSYTNQATQFSHADALSCFTAFKRNSQPELS